MWLYVVEGGSRRRWFELHRDSWWWCRLLFMRVGRCMLVKLVERDCRWLKMIEGGCRRM